MLTLDDSEALSSPARSVGKRGLARDHGCVAGDQPRPAGRAPDGRRRRIFLCGGGKHTGRAGGHADVADRQGPRGVARPARRCGAPAGDQGGRAMSGANTPNATSTWRSTARCRRRSLRGFDAWLDANPEMKARSGRFEADRDAAARRPSPAFWTNPRPKSSPRLVSGETCRRHRPPRRAVADGCRGEPASGRRRLAAIWRASAACGSSAQAEDRAGRGGDRGPRDLCRRKAARGRSRRQTTGTICSAGCPSGLGLKIVAPDLTADGFELSAAGFCLPGRSTAPHCCSTRTRGQRISVYVTAEGDEKAKGTSTAGHRRPERRLLAGQGMGLRRRGTLPEERLAEVGEERLPAASGRRRHGVSVAA